MKRRELIAYLSTISITSLIPGFLFAESPTKAVAKATKGNTGAPANLIKLDEPLAKAMQYKHMASKIPMRTNKTAFCHNCAKYNVCAPADKACKPVAKDAKYGPCSIFPKKSVAREGWCLSWQKKA